MLTAGASSSKARSIPELADHHEESPAEEEEEEEDDSSTMSSSLSIPDENINFDLVYALHTFVATVDGQASVVKGDTLILADDSNSYWWMVKVMKTSEMGYIPAENIETPFERLARLNKHRNTEVGVQDKKRVHLRLMDVSRSPVHSPSQPSQNDHLDALLDECTYQIRLNFSHR
ncbi:hypothetical protein J3Q64DRAFT_1400549 [Phycomyces blakesleeanus]|uniref:SH3 domain-containing protein n=1 Tax=Phycomyces blakesleeanus TaxID=4837 RepID=A0ABR3B5E4_PHYBL